MDRLPVTGVRESCANMASGAEVVGMALSTFVPRDHVAAMNEGVISRVWERCIRPDRYEARMGNLTVTIGAHRISVGVVCLRHR